MLFFSMNIINLFMFPVSIVCIFVLFRVFLYRTALILVLNKSWNWIEDRVHVHQLFKVPQFNEENSQFNPFYGKVSTYLNSLASIEDSDFTNLFARSKSNDILLCLDDNQTVHDEFLGARVTWKNQVEHDETTRRKKRTFVLRIKKKDKRRILRPYIQHIHTASDDIERSSRRERKFYLNTGNNDHGNGRWRSVPLTHPSTMDTMAMDSDLKNKVKSDLELFLKSKQFYHRMGRAWKRSYLLYGPSGTGKSSFIAAVSNLLSYDVYDLDLYGVTDDSDLKMLLLQTTNKSVIVVEDLDRFLLNKPSTAVSLSGVLNFMDGIASSCCGDERVFVFTANNKEVIDPALLRPGRIDVHIHFPLCDFNSFKSLANSYLGLKEHKLFPQVEEVFSAGGAGLSAAEIGEIMISNRSSPTRALKTVITALQTNADVALAKSASSLSTSGGRLKDGMAPVKELRKLYDLLRLKSTNKIGPSDHDSSTEISR